MNRQPAFGIFDILQVDPARPTADSLAERLGHHRLADELGFDYLFLAERHFMSIYRAATPALMLANLAATTTQIRLGVMAWTLPLHHPILLAEQISALDHLSGGRLEVGLGLGHRPQEIDALGIPAQHRQPIFLEGLQLLQRAWQGQPISHDGALYHVRDVLVDPPFQRPHPPLWYAGNDEERAAWAGRIGISLAIGFRPDAALAAPASAFRAARPADGPGRLALMRNIYIADSDDDARDEIVADLLRIGEALAANPGGLPVVPPHGRTTRADAERQFANLLVTQTVVAGSPTTVANEIVSTIQTLGLDVFLANVHLAGVEDARIRRTLTRFAYEVIPLVNEVIVR